MRMDTYGRAVSRAVKIWMWDNNVSADFLSLRVGITRGAFYSKMAGRRTWHIEELTRLAALGVDIPSPNKVVRAGK